MNSVRVLLSKNKFVFNQAFRKAKIATQVKLTEKDVEEVKIPMPWGHIAGKWWGPKDRRPILCLHGWQDNAGTFDNLIPILPDRYSYLAIDFPGHGFSSRFARGLMYSNYDLFTTLRRIQTHYEWNKISFLSHSLGSIYSFVYSCIFPDDVDFYIGLDNLKPVSINVAKSHKNAPKVIEQFFKNDSLPEDTTPKYTEKALIERWCKDTNNSVTEESVKILLKRGAVKTEDGLCKLLRDPKLKGDLLFGNTHADNLQLANNIKCNVLIIKATNSTYWEKKERVYEVLDVVKRKAKYVEYHYLQGTHHLHMNNPEILARVIKDFLEKIEKAGD